MMTFFAIAILLGAVFVLLEWMSEQSDSVPTELARLGNRGVWIFLLGIVGLACAWLFP